MVFSHIFKAICHTMHNLPISVSAITLCLTQSQCVVPCVLARMLLCHIDLRMNVCRAEDYWEGYKLFCYAYYSRSLQHEHEFHQSKLGSCTSWGPSILDASEFGSPVNVRYCFPTLFASARCALILCLPQGALCGNVIAIWEFLPTMPSVTHAHNYFHLWKCTASGSCKRIAAICLPSCFVLIQKLSWRVMSLDALFCS